MELLYLYIHDFRKFKKQSFIFSPEFNFVLTEQPTTSERQKYLLEISDNKKAVDLFDGNILNVTGIIGKNGAGKSSLIHLIKLMCGSLDTLLTPLIFSIRDKESKAIYTCFYNGGVSADLSRLEVNVKYGDDISLRYPNSECSGYFKKEALLDEKIYNLPFEFKDINLCYFTNVFDSHKENYYKNIHNLSTNYRVEEFLKTYIPKQVRQSSKKTTNLDDIFTSNIGAFHQKELKSMFRFLSYAKTRTAHKITDLPENVVFTFELEDFQYLVSDPLSNFSPVRDSLIKINTRVISIMKGSRDKIRNFQHMIILSAFYYSLRWNRLAKEENLNIFQSIEMLADEQMNLFESIKLLLLGQINYFNGTSKKRSITGGIEFLVGDKFFKQLEKLTFSNFDNTFNNFITYEFEINNALWPILSAIHELTEADDTFFMGYQWSGGLSSGQEAFIAQFSRLYEIKGNVGNKPIWLVIDEGDLYFHPEMQKEYFNQLFTFCKFLFPRNKVQIILSTHSPFIVSDLPKQNLIFLKRGIYGACEVDQENIHHETFGANIHDLFKESLFISGGLFGDFAREKINDIIHWCQDKNADTSKSEHIRKMIAIIGEPIIRAKLAEMLAIKMGENQELAMLREQQRYITERMNEIKGTRKNDQN